MKRRALLAAAAAAVALLQACSSTGPEPAPLGSFKAEVQPRVLWRAAAGEAGPYIFRPAVADGDVFVAGLGGVQRLQGATGRRLWRAEAGRDRRLSGGVGVGSGLVLVGTSKGEVIAYEAGSGRQRWSVRVATEVLGPPVVAGGLVLARSGDSRIAALSVADGSRKWEYIPTQQSPLLVRGAFSLTVSEGVVHAGLPAGKMVALSLDNGSVLWETALAAPRGDTELERVIDVVTDPALRDGQVCAIAHQGRVGCVDAARGTLVWARDASSVTDMASSASAFHFADEKATLYAVDRAGGGVLWKQSVLAHRSLGSPGVVGRRVVAGDFEGVLHVFDQEDGRLVGRLSTDGSAVVAAPVSTGGDGFVAVTSDGGVYAVTLR